MRTVVTPRSGLHPGFFAAAAAYPLWFVIVFSLAPAAAPIEYWGLGLAVQSLALLVGVIAVRRLGVTFRRRQIMRHLVMALILVVCLLTPRAMHHYSITWGAGLLAGLIGAGFAASERVGLRRRRMYVLSVTLGVCLAGIVLDAIGRVDGAVLLYYAAAALAGATGLYIIATRQGGPGNSDLATKRQIHSETPAEPPPPEDP